MGHGPEHHLEHAEHAAHAIHDEFNKKVTMSIAIVAAVLACVTMLGHRSHNEVLRLQGEALQLQLQAGIESTHAANHWGYYQTKNLFNLESEIVLDTMKIMKLNDSASDSEEVKQIRSHYQKNVDKYKGKLPEEVKKGKAIEAKTEEYMEQSKERMEESHFEHKKAERLDYGELGLQLGVVLCSLAILTQSRGFWGAGLLSSAIGAAVAITGQFGLLMFGGHH
jgi:hypothetical protein